MKIRTITAGVEVDYPFRESNLKPSINLLKEARELLTFHDYEVQSIRITTQPWKEYNPGEDRKKIISEIKRLEEYLIEENIDFLSIGYTDDVSTIEHIPEILANTEITSCSVNLNPGIEQYNLLLNKTSELYLKISRLNEKGSKNFNFTSIVNCPPDIPFFPAAYHRGEPVFMIGTESSDLVTQAFMKADSIEEAENKILNLFDEKFRILTNILFNLKKNHGHYFKGIDLSPAPGLSIENSITRGFERLLQGPFGSPGTLTIAGLITSMMEKINIRKCGYCGLMLPLLEDAGLALRYREDTYSISNLLEYSSVCGTGLDCIPLPGNTQPELIENTLRDITTLSRKFSKPLSCRLLPCPGKEDGDLTDFNSPYLTDTIIKKIEY